MESEEWGFSVSLPVFMLYLADVLPVNACWVWSQANGMKWGKVEEKDLCYLLKMGSERKGHICFKGGLSNGHLSLIRPQ